LSFWEEKIAKKDSACFSEIKPLPVTLFRYTEGALLTMKTLTGTRLCGQKYHTGSRLGHCTISRIFPASNLGWRDTGDWRKTTNDREGAGTEIVMRLPE
jgi:hypothetical protein